MKQLGLDQKYQRPRILWRLIEHEKKTNIIQLVLFTVENQNAYNVKFSFKEYPESLKSCEDLFPQEIPIINEKYPFAMDIDIWGTGNKVWGKDTLELMLEYEDDIGEQYHDQYIINKKKCYPLISIGNGNLEEIKKVLKDIATNIKS